MQCLKEWAASGSGRIWTLRSLCLPCFIYAGYSVKLKKIITTIYEVRRGTGAQVCDFKRDRLWGRFPIEEIMYLIFSFHRSCNDIKRGLDSATEHTIPREFGGKCVTNSLITRFPGSLCLPCYVRHTPWT